MRGAELGSHIASDIVTGRLDAAREYVPDVGMLGTALRRFSRNRLALAGVGFLTFLILLGIFADVICIRVMGHDPNQINLDRTFLPPSIEHPFGSDENGRDVFARSLYAIRVVLPVAAAAGAIAVVVGTLVGALAGFYGGRLLDAFLMRATDVMLAIPLFYLTILVVTVFGPSIPNLIVMIGLTSWMQDARIIRGEVLKLREEEYIQAARAVGNSDWRIIIFHALPNVVPQIIIGATLSAAYAIVLESGLSYLGLGVQPPTPTWGNMLSNSQSYIWMAPWLAVFPGLLIFLTVLSLNFIGDGLRDALDPKLKQ